MIRPPGIDTGISGPTGLSKSTIGNAVVLAGAPLAALSAIRFQAFERVGQWLRDATARVGAPCVGRIGGDGFGVIVPDNMSSEGVAAGILATLGHGFGCDGCGAGLDASIGYARASGRSVSADDLRRQADAAMYRAKRAGGTGRRGAEKPPALYGGHMLAVSRVSDA